MLHDIIYVPIYNALLWLVKVLPGHDLGLSIILITLAIRLILYYPSLASIKSSRQLQNLQPRLKELQAKYKDDKETLAREQMKLYKESKVNPAASCLPLIVQLLVFYQLYQVFLNGLKLTPDGFIQPDQLKDLAGGLRTYFEVNPVNATLFGWIDLSATKNIFLAVFTGLTQFWQTKMLAAPKEPKTPEARDEAMTASINRSMMYTLPILMTWITYTLPAGLGLYWSVSSLFGVIQQYIFLKTHPMKAATLPTEPKP